MVQNNSLQTDLRPKEAQVYELETSLTTVHQGLTEMQRLKDENERLKLEKCQWEEEKSDLLAQPRKSALKKRGMMFTEKIIMNLWFKIIVCKKI